MAIEEIGKGDKIVVQTGEKISVDGKIVKGEALIDQSSITGEYMPIMKKLGENEIGRASCRERVSSPV